MFDDPKSRFLMFQELQLRPRRNQGAALEIVQSDDLPSFLTLIDKAIGTDRAVYEIRKGDRVRLVRRYLPNNSDILTLIFSRGNVNVSNPQFQNVDTDAVWSAEKTSKDAAIRSCHMFVKVSKIPNRDHPTYNSLLEEVPGVGRTYIQTLLNSITSKYEYDYDPGHGDPKQTATLTNVLAVKNKRVADSGSGASIDVIELVREPQTTGLDPALIEAKSEVLPLRVKAGASSIDVMNAVRNYIKGTTWSDARIRLRLPNDRTKVVRFERDAAAADVLFAAAEKVTVSKPIPAYSDKLNDELLAKGAALLV